ncbi:MAG: DUF3822 family protein [Ferruginibacter sp.]
MNPSFHITSATGIIPTQHFYIFVSVHQVAFIVKDQHEVHQILLYKYTNEEQLLANPALLIRLIQDAGFNIPFEKVHCISALPEALVVPEDYFNPSTQSEMLDLVYGSNTNATLNQCYLKKRLAYLSFRIDTAIANVLQTQFGNIEFHHIYSLLPEINSFDTEVVHCIFEHQRMIVVVMGGNQLQLLQQYNYIQPEDASYTLLNIVEQTGLNLTSLKLILSGMIDEESGLYKEIHKYFLNIQFQPLPEQLTYPESLKENPDHFFSHLISTALCV